VDNLKAWGHPKTHKSLKIDMEIDDKSLFKHKLDYIKLLLKIIRIRNQGGDPPEQILSQASKLGQLNGVSAEELKNL
jgi:hypothetical protein